MGINRSWLVYRKTVKSTGMVMDRSLMVITSGTNVTFIRPDQSTTPLTNMVYSGQDKTFKNTSADNGPYLSCRLKEDSAHPENELLTGWISDNGSKDKLDLFLAVPSPFEATDWNVRSVNVYGSAIVKDDSPLKIEGRKMTFTVPGKITPDEEIDNVLIGVDSLTRGYVSSSLGYRIDARIVRRSDTKYLIGTIAKGTAILNAEGEFELAGDEAMDTFTAVKTGGGMGGNEDAG